MFLMVHFTGLTKSTQGPLKLFSKTFRYFANLRQHCKCRKTHTCT